MNVLEANKAIIKYLKGRWGVARASTRRYLHNYPHCWRTDEPLIYKAHELLVRAGDGLPRTAWWSSTSEIRWIPDARARRVASASGSRARGTGRSAATGSGARPCPSGRATIPDTRASTSTGASTNSSATSGSKPDRSSPPAHRRARAAQPRRSDRAVRMMRRVPDVLDCWFESGSMPFAQVHYPFENKEWFENHFPGGFHRGVHRPDPWVVLHPDGARHGALRPSAVQELHVPRHRAGSRGSEAQQAAAQLPGPGGGLRDLRLRRAALVPDRVADPARRGSAHRAGRPWDRRGRPARPQPDLERLLLLHAVRQRGRRRGALAHRLRAPAGPLHPREDARPRRGRHGRPGRLRRRGRLCTGPRVHGRAQQLVHPPEP